MVVSAYTPSPPPPKPARCSSFSHRRPYLLGLACRPSPAFRALADAVPQGPALPAHLSISVAYVSPAPLGLASWRLVPYVPGTPMFVVTGVWCTGPFVVWCLHQMLCSGRAGAVSPHLSSGLCCLASPLRGCDGAPPRQLQLPCGQRLWLLHFLTGVPEDLVELCMSPVCKRG